MMARLTARRATIVAGVVALGCVALVRASGDSAPATSEPVDLSAIGELSTDAQIAVDERGTTIAVWDNGAIKTATGRISGRATVKGAVRPAGGGWRAVTSLSSPAAGQHAYRPQLAVNARGTAVAVWDLQKDGNHVVQAAVRPAGGSWGAAVSLSRPGRACGPRIGVACRSSVAQRVTRELAPRVVIDRRGNIAAIWERFAGRSSSVQVAVRAAGGRWRAAVDVVRFPGARSQDFAEPQIALDPTGEAIAVWTRARPSARTRAKGSVRGPRERERVVQAAVRRPDGRWRAPTDLSAVARNGVHPQVALDARGNALAVWSRDGTMQGATRAPNGDWTTPVDISAAGVHAYGPALAVDRRGGAIVLWTAAGAAPDSSIVQAAARASGGPWQAPADISAAARGGFGPDVAVNARGDAVAGWTRQLRNPGDATPPPVIVQGAVRPAGGAWQPRSWRGADRVATQVQVAADPLGNLVAIWDRFDPRPGGYIVARAVTAR